MNRARIACLACLVASACSGGAASPTPPVTFAGIASIGFNNAGSHGSPFAIHRESGYVILPYGGHWTVSTSDGHPALFILFFPSGG